MATAVLPTRRKRWTDAALEALPDDGCRHELLDGELIESPLCERHGTISMAISCRLAEFVSIKQMGRIYPSGTGIRLAEDSLLSPDVAFVSSARLKKIFVAPDKFLQGAPDLVVEVLSPGDRMTQVNRKLDHYFEHGTKLAWLINWKKGQVHIYTPDSIEALTRPNEVLTGGKVLPGFKCKVSQIFGS